MTWRPDRWALGLPILALVWAAGTWLAVPRLEDDLRRIVQSQPGAEALRRAGGRIDLRGRDVVVVTDFAVPEPVRIGLERIASGVSGVRRVALEVATAVGMQPFRLTIRRDAAGLALQGGVPAGELHARLVERAVSIAGADRIDDRLAPGLGAPPGFEDAAEIALRLAGLLVRGEVVLSDRVLAIQGEAADFGAYNAATSALLELPLGYSLGRSDLAAPAVKPFTWAALRGPDGITLEGYVPSEPARTSLRATIEAAMPGITVLDRMQTARGLDGSVDFDALGRVATRALSQLQSGRAAYDGRELALSGAGPARDLLAGLPAETRRDLPSGVAPGPMLIKPVPASPYTFAARRGAGRIVLTGYVPDGSARDTIRAALDRRLPGEAVTDDLHLADGAPEGFLAAANLALESLSQLAEGRADLVDRRVALQGRSLYPDMARQTGRRISADLPAGWSGAADIRAEPFEKPLEPSLCADLLAEGARRDPVRFEANKSEVSASSRKGIEGLRAIVRRCGPARIRILVQPEPSDAPEAARSLALQRAAALAAGLDSDNSARLSSDASSSDERGTPGKAEQSSKDRISFVVEP